VTVLAARYHEAAGDRDRSGDFAQPNERGAPVAGSFVSILGEVD
jgi:hypothetical protein